MKTEPTEALANQAIKKITDSLMFEINYEEDNYDAGYSAALHNHGEALYMMGFLKGQSNPKIRQLEWEEYRDCLVSTTPFYNVSIKEVCGIYELATAYSAFIKSYNSLDEAKAAAQDDFEKRVKECLE